MRSGIDTSAIDPAVRPQDDLFTHVNGAWLATAQIPADRSRYGSFDLLRDRSEADVRALVENAAAHSEQATDHTTPDWRVGALYRSFMDTDRVEADGWSPVLEPLRRIAAVRTPSEVAATAGAQQREGGSGLLGWYIASDAGNPGTEIAYLSQSGLGLPDEAYYRDQAHAAIREAYLTYLGALLTLAQPALTQADLDLGADAPARVLALETAIAATHRDKIAARDAVKGYNKLTRTELDAATAGIDWAAWSYALTGGDEVAAQRLLEQVVARQPEQLTALGALLTSTPIADWQAWLTVRLLNSLAPYLVEEAVQTHFDFYGRTLSGTPQIKERWKRGVGLVEGLIGEDAGRMYVAEHFPEQARQRMEVLVANVIEAFRRRINALEWMSAQTREQALAKLTAFRPKIGCPPKWRDYSAFEVDPNDLIGNIRRGSAMETDHELSKVGGQVDRDEWLMTPQTVNAYYHPLMNEIVFPAAILQPPFFDVEADDAVNYGGIGAVIAHEIGHGFDDQGSRYDGDGALRDWWTQADREAFDALAGRLIAQFDQLSPRELPGEHVAGALTVGENIGDLCGLEMALSAYELAGLGPQLDGLTAVQRFFMGWGHIWQAIARPEEARRLLAVDPHSPPDLRANLPRNVAAFHEAFATEPGDGMWLDPSERVRIF